MGYYTSGLEPLTRHGAGVGTQTPGYIILGYDFKGVAHILRKSAAILDVQMGVVAQELADKQHPLHGELHALEMLTQDEMAWRLRHGQLKTPMEVVYG